MKKQSFFILFVLFLICMSCTSIKEQDMLDFDLRTFFFGTWHYPKTNMYYTITSETLEGYTPEDRTGFTARIIEWKLVENSGPNRDEYPTGYAITAGMQKMTGGWWIEIGEIDTWTWYMSNDKDRIITKNGDVVYYRR